MFSIKELLPPSCLFMKVFRIQRMQAAASCEVPRPEATNGETFPQGLPASSSTIYSSCDSAIVGGPPPLPGVPTDAVQKGPNCDVYAEAAAEAPRKSSTQQTSAGGEKQSESGHRPKRPWVCIPTDWLPNCHE